MSIRPIDELILIYNAKSGLTGAFVDSAKKLFQLKGCTLCSITHGLAGERPDWQDCKAALGVPITYYHRDDRPAQLAHLTAADLPCILARSGEDYIKLLDPDALARCNGKVADLRGRLRHRATLEGLNLS